MASWTRDEIASAFEHYQAQVRRAGETGDWDLFADLFTCLLYTSDAADE